MKKALPLILASAFLVACGNGGTTSSSQSRIALTTTNYSTYLKITSSYTEMISGSRWWLRWTVSTVPMKESYMFEDLTLKMSGDGYESIPESGILTYSYEILPVSDPSESVKIIARGGGKVQGITGYVCY